MASYGRYTQVDLSELGFLSPDRLAAPRLDREAARFALELAAVAYDFDVDAWLDAGWTDISIQADEKLLGGVAMPEYAERPLLQRLMNEWKPFSARRHIASNRIIKQAKGVLWKPDPWETGKAITMIRPLPDGRFAVAIGFMGTGKRRIDWESNFRLQHGSGFHEGFVELTEQFEDNSDRISFDQTARMLQLPQLTLEDVLIECRQADSRFVLLASGHSQGAAVLQLWLHRQLQAGMLPQHVLGYGFAPPSVAASSLGPDYPLFHFINSDDIVPRVGLLHHIGQPYIYRADDAFRSFCYQGRQTDPLFMHLLGRMDGFRGTQDAIGFLVSYLQALSSMQPAEVADAVSLLAGAGRAERLVLKRDEPLEGVLRLMRRMLWRNYELAAGRPVDEEQSDRLAQQLLPEIRQAGAENYTRMMLQVMGVPHALVFREPLTPGLAPYAYMVLRGYQEMEKL